MKNWVTMYWMSTCCCYKAAHLAQLLEISMRRPTAKSAVSSISSFRFQCCPSLWYCSCGLLVVDVQRRHYAVGDDAGAEWPRCAAGSPCGRIPAHSAGRPRSRFSRITSSKKMRPVTGWSSTWVSENSACRMESGSDNRRRGRVPETDAAGVAAICAAIDSVPCPPTARRITAASAWGTGIRLDAVVQRLERHPTLGQAGA